MRRRPSSGRHPKPYPTTDSCTAARRACFRLRFRGDGRKDEREDCCQSAHQSGARSVWKDPEFKFCAVRAKPVGIRTAAAEQATAGINRPGTLSVGERRLRRDLVLRDDGFGPREIFQQALAGQDKEVIAELRVLEVDLKQLFIADSQDAAILDTF